MFSLLRLFVDSQTISYLNKPSTVLASSGFDFFFIIKNFVPRVNLIPADQNTSITTVRITLTANGTATIPQ